jgi:hypothetical protein
MRLAEHVIFCPPTLGKGRPILVMHYHYSLFHSMSLERIFLRGKRIHPFPAMFAFVRRRELVPLPTRPTQSVIERPLA